MEHTLLKMTGIKKYIFDLSGKPVRGTDVLILNDVHFDLRAGEVNVLLGENGAGKSTLMKILAGEIPHDEGSVVLDGEEVEFNNPKQARAKGVTFIHQELNLCTNLNVAQNIFMGREFTKGRMVIDWKRMYEESRKLIRSLGFEIDVQKSLGSLSTAQQQVVEIAKAFSYHSKILIMDEPTASLTSQEIKQLFRLVKKMRDAGLGIIFISHRMDEVEEIADRVTVMKDGTSVGILQKSEFTVDKAIQMMTGRTLENIYTNTHVVQNEKILEVKNFKIGDKTEPFNLYVKKGEIVGIGGLVGAGRTEFAKAVFGAREYGGGEVFLAGKVLKKRSPKCCIEKGIIYLSEDRKREGLVLSMPISENISLASLKKILVGGLISKTKEKNSAIEMIDRFRILCRDTNQRINTLSGGNQQKVCFAKWYVTNPEVLILDEPTRGVDVNAKAQIYQLMDELSRMGKAILMITSEMNELLGMSDRIYIMREGNVVKELKERSEMTDETILQYTIGIK
ncbi:MAG: sugar ABC transporter ATP-binding protein [Eubacteriales bacterium]|nr:sugar ABC transporter ATP-binding protein [Eubacteriales bacterium]